MSVKLSEEQLNLIEKFGFRVQGSSVFHRKLGVEREIERFARFSSLSELEDYIKSLLRAS